MPSTITFGSRHARELQEHLINALAWDKHTLSYPPSFVNNSDKSLLFDDLGSVNSRPGLITSIGANPAGVNEIDNACNANNKQTNEW